MGGATLDALAALPLQVHSAQAFVALAFEIACASGRSVYESSYLAIAVARRCPLVTAARRFHDALKRSGFGPRLLWVADVP